MGWGKQIKSTREKNENSTQNSLLGVISFYETYFYHHHFCCRDMTLFEIHICIKEIWYSRMFGTSWSMSRACPPFSTISFFIFFLVFCTNNKYFWKRFSVSFFFFSSSSSRVFSAFFFFLSRKCRFLPFYFNKM